MIARISGSRLIASHLMPHVLMMSSIVRSTEGSAAGPIVAMTDRHDDARARASHEGFQTAYLW